jgi:hypothetical protein
VHVKSLDAHRARALLGARQQLVGMVSAWVTIRRNRPLLSPASCHPEATQASAMIGARTSH